MDSVDIEVLRTAQAWRKSGHRAALGTIVKTWGSAPRPVGAMVAITLVCAVGGYTFFNDVLKVPLPAGPFDAPFDAVIGLIRSVMGG